MCFLPSSKLVHTVAPSSFEYLNQIFITSSLAFIPETMTEGNRGRQNLVDVLCEHLKLIIIICRPLLLSLQNTHVNFNMYSIFDILVYITMCIFAHHCARFDWWLEVDIANLNTDNFAVIPIWCLNDQSKIIHKPKPL